MKLISDLRELWELGPGGMQASPRTEEELRRQTESFCRATTLETQTGNLIELFTGIWSPRSERVY